MKQDNIFFGEQGLTATSADFVANMAKEMLRKDESKIEGISFVNEEFSAVSNPTKSQLSLGLDEQGVREVSAIMQRVVRLKSLIAWLREGIKAKNRLMEEVRSMTQNAFWEDVLGKESILCPDPIYPMTKDEYLSTLSVADRNRMFALETKAAVLGKILHKDGAFERARERMFSVKASPRELVSKGVNNLIYYYEPSVEAEVVDDVYFKLTNEYREAQAGLNSYLHVMEAAIQQSEIEAAQKNMELNREYQNKKKEVQYMFNEWQSKETKRINNLKIIIPNSLKDIYEEVQKVGK